MKNILLFVAGVVLTFAACTKEPTPEPSEVKRNWLEITEPVDPDEVDQKIWDLYREYGVPIFYTDTLGSVDYGVVDENGKPVLSYQMIYPTEDMTGTGGTSAVVTPVQHWVATEKAELMYILNMIETDLLPMAKRGELDIPVIYLAGSLTLNSGVIRVYRANNVLTINSYTGMMPSMLVQMTVNNNKKSYRTEVIANSVGRAWTEELAPFYAVTEELLLPYELTDPWSTPGGLSTMWSENIVRKALPDVSWIDIQKNIWILNNYTAQYPVLQSYIPWFTNPPRTDYEMVAFYADQVNAWDIVKSQESLWRQRAEKYDPRSFGITNWLNAWGYAYNIMSVAPRNLDGFLTGTFLDSFAVPTRQADLTAYINYLVNYTQAQLETTGSSAWNFGAWPVVLERLAILRRVLEDKGLDPEVLGDRVTLPVVP